MNVQQDQGQSGVALGHLVTGRIDVPSKVDLHEEHCYLDSDTDVEEHDLVSAYVAFLSYLGQCSFIAGKGDQYCRQCETGRKQEGRNRQCELLGCPSGPPAHDCRY
jgi:hypothetical protein